MILIRPSSSTTKRRGSPWPAFVTKSGSVKPSLTSVIGSPAAAVGSAPAHAITSDATTSAIEDRRKLSLSVTMRPLSSLALIDQVDPAAQVDEIDTAVRSFAEGADAEIRVDYRRGQLRASRETRLDDPDLARTEVAEDVVAIERCAGPSRNVPTGDGAVAAAERAMRVLGDGQLLAVVRAQVAGRTV